MGEATGTRPAATEYAPYFEKYVSLVPEGNVLDTLSRQHEETLALLRGLSEEQGDTSYAEGKWTIKELVGHVIDSERIFGYRALCFARDDRTPLPGFEQDDYIANANFKDYSLNELATEFELVRKANLSLFHHLNEDAWERRGVANENEVSVRALAYLIAGHEAHHVRILRERYL